MWFPNLRTSWCCLPVTSGAGTAISSRQHASSVQPVLQHARAGAAAGKGASQPAPGVGGGSWWSWFAALYGLSSSGVTFLGSLSSHCPALQSGTKNRLCMMAQAGFGISSSASFLLAFRLLLVALIIFRAVSLSVFYQIM